ncbi:hypothetical protein [Streptomyces thermodiastaticus]|nr:hypothetical protein [Streptomyces thermodiastaticus]MCE7549206.1 hypothetical protein [Streptomyces thermodiastaticus]
MSAPVYVWLLVEFSGPLPWRGQRLRRTGGWSDTFRGYGRCPVTRQ